MDEWVIVNKSEKDIIAGNEVISSGRKCRFIPEAELTAANKAIVALSEALDMHERSPLFITRKEWLRVMRKKSNEVLTAHAPAIEKARGG